MDFLVFPLISLLAWIAIQTATTTDRVLLLPNATGGVGALVVKTRNDEKTLDHAFAGAQINGLGRIEVEHVASTSLPESFAAAVNALPAKPVTFTVYFLTGSDTELATESIPVLEQLKSALASRSVPEVTVIGHTDRVGKLEDNDALSIRRAANVKSILSKLGVAGVSFEVAGRGEREPLVTTEDEVPEAKNRRVEINLR
jgi:outer membrane protein OmpA-like peptidoglycan-associated protein